jgi:hypothetical protein
MDKNNLSEKGLQKKKEVVKEMRKQKEDDWKTYFSELNDRGKGYNDFMVHEEPETRVDEEPKVQAVPQQEIPSHAVRNSTMQKGSKTLQEPPPNTLTEKEELIKTRVVEEVIKKAYIFATSGGKTKLQDLQQTKVIKKDVKEIFKADLGKILKKDVDKLLVEEKKVRHIEKISAFIKNGFEQEFSGDKVVLASKENIISRLLEETGEIFSDIEEYDRGATQYMRDLIAKALLQGNGHKRYSRN